MLKSDYKVKSTKS